MPISTLDRPDILNVLFHPRHIFGPAYSTPSIRLIDIEVEPGITLGGRVYPAENTSPVILYFHGNGEIAADYDDIVPLYTQLGITLLSDALAVYKSVDQALEENGLYPSKLYVMGRSLGSAAALEIAIHEELKFDGLIIESGFSDTFALLARIGGIQLPGADDQVDGFGNLSKVGRVSVPTLIIHGLKDVLIPSAEGVQLYENCAAEQKQLLLIPDAGHNDIMYVGRNQYMAAIQEFTTPNSAS
jgi:pimeloyl-ACP methyl ester carboxylesterase